MAKPENANSLDQASGGCRQPKVNVVTTPLKKPEVALKKPRFRDINEDDDGYHPYCDGPERPCRFEQDPWS